MTEKPKPNRRRKRGCMILVGIVMLLACAVVVLMGSYSLVLATHQDEL